MSGPPDAPDSRGVSVRPSFGWLPRVRIGWLVGLVLAVVLVLVLGRVALDAADASARVESLRQANAELRTEVDALIAQKQLVTSPVFVQVAGRGHGYGRPNERAFGLVPGAPSPAPLVSDEASPQDQGSALEAWLRLLFGR